MEKEKIKEIDYPYPDEKFIIDQYKKNPDDTYNWSEIKDKI